MRHQYYADSRDVFKWSVLLRLIHRYNFRTVLQVAMLRPDDDTSEGGTVHSPSIVESPVQQFFETERLALARNPSLRNIRRVTDLAAACGGSFDIRVFDREFNRVGYWEAVAAELKKSCPPVLVFLDPDTGLGNGKGPRRHFQIRPEEVQGVYGSLREGDVLATFQYAWRRKDWVQHLRGIFQGAVAGAEVECSAGPNIAIFSAMRGPDYHGTLAG